MAHSQRVRPNTQPATKSEQLGTERQLASAIVPIVAAIAVYLPALGNGFIWDDPLVLQQLRAIRSVGDLLVLPPIIPSYYYRPIIFITYLADRALAGETPFWFHASVIGWHALSTFLVFLLARQLFPASWGIAAGGALLFAVHPVHVESVAWMAGRSDVVVCALMLITILLCAQRAQPWSAWAGGGTLLLALLSKEIAIACVILVPALDLLGMRRLEPPRYVPLLLAVIIYLVLRSLTVGAIVGGLPTGAPVSQIVVDLVTAVGFYIARAALPAGLCAYIPALPHGGGYTLAGVIAPLLAIGLGALAWRRGLWPLVFLAIWFFVTLVPSLTVIVRRSASVVLADRYLYVPSVAWCLLLAWVIVRGAELRRIDARWAGLVIVALAALFAAKLIPYTRVWSDNITFWSDVSVKVPHDGLPQRELGTALIERGRLDEAERAFRSALAGSAPPEGRAMTYSNLGNLYRRLDRHDEALQAFAEALKIRPHPVTFHNLGMTLMVKIEKEQRAGDEAAVLRDITSARAAFERALLLGDAPNAPPAFRQEWDAAKTHALLGQVLFSLGDRAGARQHLETALRLQPTGPAADLTRRYLQSIGQ